MTLKHRRKFTREFKLQVLAEIAAGKSVAQAAREHQLHPTLIGRWQKHHRQYSDRAFSGNGQAYTDEARVAELERMVGRLTMENGLLKSLAAARSSLAQGAGQFKEVMLKLATQHLSGGVRLPVAATIETLALSRATYYRRQASLPQPDPDTELRDHIQRVALDWPCYGYRRISAQLHRQGITANHKRVLRLMREDNLLCLRKRRFISATDSRHSLTIYPNLVPELTLSSINQLWVADITYIRLAREFIYLAVILDAYSRRCIGWALEPYLEAELAVEALRMALATRKVEPGLVHHSDRGVQYASSAYTDLLKEQGTRISMSRPGNPYDNAQAERFMRTLKYEEVYLFEYETVAEARARISQFLEEVYNHKRLHSAIGYVPPAEYEQQLCQTTDA